MIFAALAGCASPISRADSADAATSGDVKDAGPAATYTVGTYIGGYDRLGILRKDAVTGECASLVLYDGNDSRLPFALDLPTGWEVEGAQLGLPESGECKDWRHAGRAEAIAGTGYVRFESDGGYMPRSVSFDFTLSFDGGTQVRFEAEQVPAGF